MGDKKAAVEKIIVSFKKYCKLYKYPLNDKIINESYERLMNSSWEDLNTVYNIYETNIEKFEENSKKKSKKKSKKEKPIMYIRLCDDNEAVGSEKLFRNKEEVIEWMENLYYPKEVVDSFKKNGRLYGQNQGNGCYDYIAPIYFEIDVEE